MPGPRAVADAPTSFTKAYKQLLLTQSHLKAGSVVRDFACGIIPWPLQTERYARAALENSTFEIPQERIDELVRHHSGRLEYLLGTGAKLRFLLDEAVLHRNVGSPDLTIMLDQLMFLRDYANDSVTIRILHFEAGPYPVMQCPVVIVEVNALNRCLYCEDAISGHAELNTALGVRYRNAFDLAWRRALPRADGLRFLGQRIIALREQLGPRD